MTLPVFLELLKYRQLRQRFRPQIGKVLELEGLTRRV